MYNFVPPPGGGKEKVMKVTNRKRTVIVMLIMAMLITLVPTANVSAESIAYLTEDPNADLYPFPLDMKVLSKYLYGSEENTKGKVYATYGRAIPKEWVPREMPQSLKNYGVKAHAVVHTQTAKVYFYPGETSVNYHKKRIEELSQTAYRYMGTHPDGQANLAFYCAISSEFKVIAYNELWAAIWSPGGIDVGQGLSSTCGGIGTEQYGSWKPGVYFIPRKNVYITDARNQQLEIPEITASGTATCNIYVKTTPASDKYVAAGLIESNQLFQITKTTPINGHYQIYYKQGLYYVNAKYVNLRQSDENKPVMQYDAVVTADNPVNITSEANASSSVEGIVKKDAKLQVVKKNYGNGYSQVWFNSKKCYIPTKNLTGFEKYMSFSDIKKLGKPKGKLVLNAAWSGWGNTAYTAEALKILKKYHMNPYSYKVEQKIKAINGSYHMEDGDCATVYGINKYSYYSEDFPDYKEKTTIYKILYKGKVCYTMDLGHETINYYPGNKYSKKVKAETKELWIYCNKRSNGGMVECYKIDGSYYYYKLDDIAYLMSKTNKSFNVTYDKANNAIIIDSMTSYKGKAVTLKKGNGKNHKVIVPATSIVWDGKVVGIPCYKIDGAYYVSAAAIAELTDSRFEDTHYGWSIAPLLPNKIDAYG